MKVGKRQRASTLVETIWRKQFQQATELEQLHKIYESFQIYADLSDSFKGLRDVSEAEKKLNKLSASREVRDALRGEIEEIRKQRKLEKQVYGRLAGQPQGVDAFSEADRLQGGGPDRQSPATRAADRDVVAHSAILAH